MTKEKANAFFKNMLLFLAPALAVFFGQMALGVDPKKAALVALLGFYGTMADLFKKIQQSKEEK